jgi:hypothetical protein
VIYYHSGAFAAERQDVRRQQDFEAYLPHFCAQ